MESEFVKELVLINKLVSFLFDVARLAAGFALGGYIALSLTRRCGGSKR